MEMRGAGGSQKGAITFYRSRVSLRVQCVLSVFAAWMLTTVLTAYRAQNPQSLPGNAAKNGVSVAAGRRSFESHCSPCHGLDGRGGEHAHAIATPSAAGALEDVAVAQIIRGGIPAKGMPSFSSLSEQETRDIVAYVRLLTGKSTARPTKGNSARGEQLFFGKARCGDCHMMLGKGGFIGSDLTDFVGTHSVDELRQAIVNPDRWVAPAQSAVTVTLQSGQRITGMVRNEDNFSLQLQDTDGVFHLLDKSQIAKLDRASLMPADYGTRLTPAELDDLISFLFSGLPAPAHASPGAVRPARDAVPKQPAEAK